MKSGLRLLLVDDNPADVELTREALAKSPHHSEIESVEDGAEALAFLARRESMRMRFAPIWCFWA